jgi:hypothetical protein
MGSTSEVRGGPPPPPWPLQPTHVFTLGFAARLGPACWGNEWWSCRRADGEFVHKTAGHSTLAAGLFCMHASYFSAGGGVVRTALAGFVPEEEPKLLVMTYRTCFAPAVRTQYSNAKVAIRNVRVWHGDREWNLERRKNPKLAWRTCACEYGLQSWQGKLVGVAKRPRERSPTRNPYRHDSRLLSSLCDGSVWAG